VVLAVGGGIWRGEAETGGAGLSAGADAGNCRLDFGASAGVDVRLVGALSHISNSAGMAIKAMIVSRKGAMDGF
jgi:hypothetical protein